MAYAFVQKGFGYASGTNIATAVTGTGTGATALSANTAGNTLVAYVGAYTSAASKATGTVSITDTRGNTWVEDTTGRNFQASNGWQNVFYCSNCAAGANAVTATDSAPTGTTIMEITVVEYSGLAKTSAYAGSKINFAGVNTTGTDLITTGTFTPTGQPFALIGFSFGVSYTTTYPISAGTGFTSRGFDSNGLGVETEDLRGTSTSAIAATFTATLPSGNNQGYMNYGLALLENAGGSTPNAPTSIVAVAGVASATVSFTNPTVGSPFTNFTATSTPGSITGSNSVSPVTVTGLTNGTSYTFTVAATNSAGVGTSSAASNSVTPQAAPATPAQILGGAKQTFVNEILQQF